jgi:hypothetical protein
MVSRFVIDGNNLLHTMRAHAPIPLVGRETMIQLIDRWARRGEDEVIVVLDGPPPAGPLARQMTPNRIGVRFSSPRSADDLIVELIQAASDPRRLYVISADSAILYEAHVRGCPTTKPLDFLSMLFPAPPKRMRPEGPAPHDSCDDAEKPKQVSDGEAKELERRLGNIADELFDGLEFP